MLKSLTQSQDAKKNKEKRSAHYRSYFEHKPLVAELMEDLKNKQPSQKFNEEGYEPLSSRKAPKLRREDDNRGDESESINEMTDKESSGENAEENGHNEVGQGGEKHQAKNTYEDEKSDTENDTKLEEASDEDEQNDN